MKDKENRRLDAFLVWSLAITLYTAVWSFVVFRLHLQWYQQGILFWVTAWVLGKASFHAIEGIHYDEIPLTDLDDFLKEQE